MHNATQLKNYPVSPLEFMGGQLVLMHPLFAPLWLLGLGALLFARRFAAVRALGVMYLVLLAGMIQQKAKVYYLGPVYPVLFAAGAGGRADFCARRGWRPGPALAGGVLVAAGIVGLPLAVPLLPPAAFLRFSPAPGG